MQPRKTLTARFVSLCVCLFAAPSLAGTVDTTVSTFAGLQTAIASLAGSPGVIELRTATYTASTTTIPDNVTLVMRSGAVFSVGPGVTLTFNGPIVAGRQRLFNLTGGAVYLGNNNNNFDAIYPEWFYAGSGSWHVAINQALVFSTASSPKVPVQLAGRTYGISGTIQMPGGSVLSGQSARTTSIRRTANAIDLVAMGSNCSVRHLTVDGAYGPPPGTPPGGGAGITCLGSSAAEIDGCDLHDLIVTNNGGQGIAFRRATGARVRNVVVAGNWERGINISEFSHDILVSDIRGTNNFNSDILIGWGSHSNSVSNCTLEKTSNANLWVHQDAHDNNITNIRIRSPQTPGSGHGVIVWNAYRNHFHNLTIEGLGVGVILSADSLACTPMPPEGSYWDDDTRDNVISNLTFASAGALAAVRFNASLGPNGQCGFRDVRSNIVSNLIADGPEYAVLGDGNQLGTENVTANVVDDTVVVHGTTQKTNWTNQRGNIERSQ